jgi:tetratricopeptide (TPR) repeat protein
MYQKRTKQISLDENSVSYIGVHLSPGNRWVKLAQIIPWDRLEGKYHQTFANPKVGNPAKSCRMAIGSLIIKERLGLSDIETVEMIAEHPYLQFFIGLHSFTDRAPFDSSTMTYFRKRLTPEILNEINQMIIEASKNDDDPGDPQATGGPDARETAEPENQGTLIVDATCAPADIHFPTDVSLLNEGREKLEEIIDQLHEPGRGEKPRTYRQVARQAYLRFARCRKPRYKQIRKAIRQQLAFVRRDLKLIGELLQQSERALSPRQAQYLETIQELYGQQQAMYEQKTHRIEDRIVSIHQPWVRPIVRGKATADVEFGAKISVSLVNGYAMIERLDWNAYNEAGDLKEAVERYKMRYGFYPERILADKIYRNRGNLQYCEKLNIRMNGPKLGRPPADKAIYAEQKWLERLDAGERNAVEGKFGEGKRCYGLGRVMTRLKNTSEVSIHLTFLVMNLEKRLRDLIFAIYRWLLGQAPEAAAA